VDEIFIGVLIGALLTAGFGRVFFISRFETCRKKIGALTLTVFAVVLLLTPALVDARVWTFAVIGDSRGKSAEEDSDKWDFDSKKSYEKYKNWDYLWRIAKDISKQNCALVIFTGDLIWGDKAHAKQYENWKKAMAPVFNARIPTYPVRGNHEEWGDKDASRWRAFVKDQLDVRPIPTNGPSGEKLCTYSFAHENALFVGLDEYFGCKGTHCPHKISQTWLVSQLQMNTKPHVFVYAHTPAFQVSRFAGATGAIYEHADIRDAMWKAQRNGGVRVYFSGHIHFYTGNTIKKFDLPKLYQVCNGIGGAGFDPFKGYNIDTTYVDESSSNEDKYHGYNLVQIDDNKVTVRLRTYNAKTREWMALERHKFSYTVIQPPPPKLTVSIQGKEASLSWSAVSGATGYNLLYTRFPYEGGYIDSADMGNRTSYSVPLPSGAAYYAAARARSKDGISGFSNIEKVAIP